MKVPLADLAAQNAALEPELSAAVAGVLKSGCFILGPEVEAFERAFASVVGVSDAVGMSSGTDALLVSLQALRIGAGDEVITTPFTFVATAEAIARTGARARFVDIEPPGFNLDPAAVEAAISPRTRAILPVHLFGMPARLDALERLAAQHDLPLVEDAAQALGAALASRPVGSWGRACAFSFFPSKPLGGLGDGGLIATSDPELGRIARQLREHGARRKHLEHDRLGGNFRLDALQAAVLRRKLAHVPSWQQARTAHAEAYSSAFADLAGLTLPKPLPDAQSAWSQYTVRVHEGRRDALGAHLAHSSISTAVYYPRPLHLLACFAEVSPGPGALPESERAAGEVLSLPVHAELDADQQAHVIASVREFFGASR